MKNKYRMVAFISACLLSFGSSIVPSQVNSARSENEPAQQMQFGAESKLHIPETEISQRMIENSKKSIELNNAFTAHIQALLKAADGYDVETYRKADDQLSDIMQQLEANYLEYTMLLEVAPPEWRNLPETQKFLELNKTAMQKTRMFVYKSSMVFYLCFGLPAQASHYGALSGALAQANPDERENLADILFYSGAASCWSGDYDAAEKQLKGALELNPKSKYAPSYLAEAFIAKGQFGKAAETLLAARSATTNEELKGNLDRQLALAYTLSNQKSLAHQYIESAKTALQKETTREFKGIAKESLGIVYALAGQYETAERQLSDALPILQMSPINLGNRLEAGQAALWRSYCREKLGDKVGAAEDRKYSLSISDEASHMSRLARLLDPKFGHKEAPLSVAEIRDRWAVVVGVSDFRDAQVPKLRYPAKDAVDVRDFLVNTAAFQPDHVKVLLNQDATRASICDGTIGKWLPSVVKPGDLVFLFISSHGTPAYKQVGALNALVTYDTELEHLFTTSVPLQSLVRTLRNKLKRQHVFVVLDTCYSGGLGAPGEEARTNANVDPDLLLISNYQLLVSSSSSSERSWESRRYPNSVFTRQMLESLSRYPRYDDFRSVFREIADKVNLEVSSDFKNKQTPTLAGRWSGKGLIKLAPLKSAQLSRAEMQ